MGIRLRTYKTKLKLNNKKRNKLHANASVSRYAYNLTLEMQEESYKNGGKFISDRDIRKLITIRKKNKEDLYWMYSYDCDIVKQAVKDACNAYKKFFKGLSGRPKFKSKKFSKESFYIDTYKLRVKDKSIIIPLVGEINLYEKAYIPQNIKYYNPRITFDGIHWFISVGIDDNVKDIKLTDELIGIDLGLKNLVTCSNNMIFNNITKSKNYRKIIKSKKQKQRQISKKYELNKRRNKFIRTKNIEKIQKRINKKQIKLNNIKKDYFHKSTTALVRTKPKAIVVEDLDVAGMMKNKYLSYAFQETSISTWKTILTNKCIRDKIEVIEADRFYPSSKLCSNCNSYKSELKLSDRIYKCSSCGLKLDRDYNASLNLQKYPQFEGNSSLWRAKQTQVA